MSTFLSILPIIIALVLYFTGIPIAYALFAAALTYFGFIDTTTMPYLLMQKFVTATQSFPFLAIPFFIMCGSIMNYGGISARLMDFADALTGHMRGGLAQINVLLSMLMGGCSGSANADAAMECKLLVPEMEKRGYGKGFSAAITAASSCVTPIIPPGINLIVYGLIAGASVGQLRNAFRGQGGGPQRGEQFVGPFEQRRALDRVQDNVPVEIIQVDLAENDADGQLFAGPRPAPAERGVDEGSAPRAADQVILLDQLPDSGFDGDRADLERVAQLPRRRNFLAGAQHAVVDQRTQRIGYLHVQRRIRIPRTFEGKLVIHPLPVSAVFLRRRNSCSERESPAGGAHCILYMIMTHFPPNVNTVSIKKQRKYDHTL